MRLIALHISVPYFFLCSIASNGNIAEEEKAEQNLPVKWEIAKVKPQAVICTTDAEPFTIDQAGSGGFLWVYHDVVTINVECH